MQKSNTNNKDNLGRNAVIAAIVFIAIALCLIIKGAATHSNSYENQLKNAREWQTKAEPLFARDGFWNDYAKAAVDDEGKTYAVVELEKALSDIDLRVKYCDGQIVIEPKKPLGWLSFRLQLPVVHYYYEGDGYYVYRCYCVTRLSYKFDDGAWGFVKQTGEETDTGSRYVIVDGVFVELTDNVVREIEYSIMSMIRMDLDMLDAAKDEALEYGSQSSEDA